ncbi:MAG: hypothetical protein ABWK05_00520 [Pyrobaculum sp.]
MDKFDVALGLAAVVFISLVLSGLWSLVYMPHCGVLSGYVILGVLTGASLLLSRWYKTLETVGMGLLLLYLLAMWVTAANPGSLLGC